MRPFPRLQLLRNESAQDTFPACPSTRPPPNGHPRPAPPLRLNTRQMQKQLAQTMRESEEKRSTCTHMHADRDTGHPHQFSPGQRQVPPECRRRSRPSNSKEKDSRCPAHINFGEQPKQIHACCTAENRSKHRPCKGTSSLGLSSSPLKAVSRADESDTWTLAVLYRHKHSAVHPHQFSPGQRQVPPECGRRSRPSNSSEKESRCPALINLGLQPKQTMLVAAADNLK